jgi:hypothetical protein
MDAQRAAPNDPTIACALIGVLVVQCVIAAGERREGQRQAADPIARPMAAPGLAHWNARELRSLPGLGERRAVAIVRARWEGEVDGSLDSLEALPGIGPETVRAMREELERRSPSP